ncbi:uncharacterized protein BJ171DRAFT_472313 [Polychytrium aggregatum]|uniref:uncharacterized protein n=1 Tax=Polychytrium aggregatum TaxID=110093 RepID=UPI0022FF3DA7|nr:uncharacterized protein BJ171DRAFT_472313 [Polychytrium aggregatum]KAI9208039.1 hypothetical protein BJ171DRAFT_472313 [Polychytrium aggregatum]
MATVGNDKSLRTSRLENTRPNDAEDLDSALCRIQLDVDRVNALAETLWPSTSETGQAPFVSIHLEDSDTICYEPLNEEIHSRFMSSIKDCVQWGLTKGGEANKPSRSRRNSIAYPKPSRGHQADKTHQVSPDVLPVLGVSSAAPPTHLAKRPRQASLMLPKIAGYVDEAVPYPPAIPTLHNPVHLPQIQASQGPSSAIEHPTSSTKPVDTGQRSTRTKLVRFQLDAHKTSTSESSKPSQQRISVVLHRPNSSTEAEEQHKWLWKSPDDLEHLTHLLQRSPFERTSTDIHTIARLLKPVPIFQNYPEKQLLLLAAMARYQECPPGTLIFKEGAQGDHWYVVLEGELDVIKTLALARTKSFRATMNVEPNLEFLPYSSNLLSQMVDGSRSQSSNYEGTRIIKKLERRIGTVKAGEGFGELAILKNQKRMASVLSRTDCKLVVVDSVTYKRSIRAIHEEVPFMNAIPYKERENICSTLGTLLVVREYLPRMLVVAEGSIVSELGFIISGTCEILKTLTHQGVTKKYVIGKLGPGEYFGEGPVVSRFLGDIYSKVEIRSMARVEIGYLFAYTAKVFLANHIPATEWFDLDEKHGLAKYMAFMERVHWDRFKKSCLDKYVREKYQDPTVDYQQFQHMAGLWPKHHRFRNI